jgi:uncharacterized protein YdeI (YjbR/CyaY-like superfamily)
MPTKDKRVDAYIEKSAEFAKPILTHIRAVVHEACPEVQEEMKWSFPHFSYKGMYCSMAAFKEHCAMNFWKGALIFGKQERESMGHLGKIASVKDLPPRKELLKYLKEAKRLNDEGVAVEKPKKNGEKKELVVPDYFAAALKKNKKAQATWEAFSYSHRKEYLEWVTEAKQEETRQRRLAQTLEWLA